jgi:hypothetical protein
LSPKILRKTQKHKNQFLVIITIFLQQIFKIGVTNKLSKKIPIIRGIICHSCAIFHRVISIFRKSQILDEGIQGQNSCFFEIAFTVKYNKTK